MEEKNGKTLGLNLQKINRFLNGSFKTKQIGLKAFCLLNRRNILEII
jgi:hypothetical protein